MNAADPRVQDLLLQYQKTYPGVDLSQPVLIDRSPEEVALGFLNNCAYAVEMMPIFQFGYYAGTIGDYDCGAV